MGVYLGDVSNCLGIEFTRQIVQIKFKMLFAIPVSTYFIGLQYQVKEEQRQLQDRTSVAVTNLGHFSIFITEGNIG